MNHCPTRSPLSIPLLLAFCTVPVFAAGELDPTSIGDASGATPSVAEDGVVRIGWSRTDVPVIVKGNLIEIILNDKKLFEVENDTFTEAGKIGLWTKADAVTQFDDLRATSLDQSEQCG